MKTQKLKISRTGLDLIKGYEGFRARSAELPDGRWTVGYGHTKSAREGIRITERDAEDLLRYDLQTVETAVRAWALAPLHQNEFDALVSLAWNIGLQNFRSSSVLSSLNAGEPLAAAENFAIWRKARVEGRLIVIDALVRRRAAEKALFLNHPSGPPAAPTPIIRPEKDGSLRVLEPVQPTVSLDVPLNGDDTRPRAIGLLDTVDDAVPRKTPEQAAEQVRERLSRILEDSEEELEARTSERETADNDDEPVIAPVVADTPLDDGPKHDEAIITVTNGNGHPDPGFANGIVDAPLKAELAPEDVTGLNTGDVINEPSWDSLTDAAPLQPLEDAPPVDDGTDDIVLTEARPETDAPEIAPTREVKRSWWNVLAFSILSLLGGSMIALGGYDWWQLIQSGEVISQNELYAGPFLMLVGIVGLLIGVYYLIRALLGEES